MVHQIVNDAAFVMHTGDSNAVLYLRLGSRRFAEAPALMLHVERPKLYQFLTGPIQQFLALPEPAERHSRKDNDSSWPPASHTINDVEVSCLHNQLPGVKRVQSQLCYALQNSWPT